MAYEHRPGAVPPGAIVRILAIVAFLIGACLIARTAEEAFLRFGAWFIVGILGGGALYRARELVGMRRTGVRIAPDRITWRTAWEEDAVAWTDVERCMLVTGRGLTIRLKLRDGATHVVPPECLPADPAPVLDAIRRDVLPADPGIRLSLDAQELGPDPAPPPSPPAGPA